MLWEADITASGPDAALAGLIDAWQAPGNKVFVLRNSDAADPKQWYSDHFPAIGTPVPFAEDATVSDREQQRTGEVWMEVRFDPTIPDAYRHSAEAQPLHTDGSYIAEFPNATLMTCVANATEGGETTFIEACDVVDALRSENPDLLEALTAARLRHARSGDSRTEYVIDTGSDPVLVNWNYYCVAKDVSAEERETAERFFRFLSCSPTIAARTLAVKLDPGDAVTWKDRQVLHGRNGFVAHAASERFLWKCAIDIGRFG